jgi:alpha-galactosidase
MNFDIPGAREKFTENVNVFFHPGPARSRVCRQFTRYDPVIPSVLFLTHFLPDKPRLSQMAALSSLVLGGNGIWGDLLSLDDDDIELFHDVLTLYKEVRESVAEAYPRTKGFIGASPEIHEKIEYGRGSGIIVLFTKQPADVYHVTKKLPRGDYRILGADSYQFDEEGRCHINAALSYGESRIIFVMRN